jgi:LPXTG-motif cell wall-anchored protein
LIEVSGQVRAPVDYEVTDTTGDKVLATVTVTYLPVAVDDEDLGNDRGAFDPSSARILDPAGNLVLRLVVAGEGVWTVDQVTGAVTFTPETGFGKDPTPVTYQITDLNGNDTRSLVTIRYLPPMLPSTGTDVTPAWAAALLLLLGLGGLLWSRRRTARG